VQRLAERPGILVTGQVADVRPYIAHAHAAVAPLRVARGIQNKVLEAMALGRPLVMTRAAAEGIPLQGLSGVVVSDEVAGLAQACSACLRPEVAPVADRELRSWLCRHYDWNINLARLDRYFATPDPEPGNLRTAGMGY
jgi:glycosyltransferase involved in cell wall biosynthesis